MARAIEELERLRIGYAELGIHGDRQGSVEQQVHDGDTIHGQSSRQGAGGRDRREGGAHMLTATLRRKDD